MTLTSANDFASIFKDGKLKPGIYMIQNVVSQTYVDMREHSRELCCRPDTRLEGKGLWEILPSGPGYTIRRLEPGNPDKFCIMLFGLGNESAVSVAAFPVAWRMEIVHDDCYRECEYVRFFWGSTNMTWDLRDNGSDRDCTVVQLKDNRGFHACRVWKLVPMELDAGEFQPVPEARSVPTPRLGHLPPYYGNPGDQRCTCSHQHAETSDDGFGTTVVEVTVTTTTNTTTTRKKYRVEEN